MAVAARASGRRPHARRSARRAHAVRRRRGAAGAAGGLAPATGLTLPRLGRVPRELELHAGEEDMIRIARALIAADVAEPGDWRRRRDPAAFLQATLHRWVREGYAALPWHPSMVITLVQSPADITGDHDHQPPPAAPDRYLIMVSPTGYDGANLGVTLRLLEHYHPRLPATFYALLTEALGAHVDLWTWQRASELAYEDAWQRWDDWDEPEQGPRPAEPTTPRDVASKYVPASVLRKPLSERALRDRMRELPAGGAAQRVLEDVLQLHQIAAPAKWRAIPETAFGRLGGYGFEDSWPAFYLGFDPLDDFEGLFDYWSQFAGQTGEEPYPNMVVELDAARPETLVAARERVELCCRVIGTGRQLLGRLPHSDDAQALGNILDVREGEPVRIRVGVAA